MTVLERVKVVAARFFNDQRVSLFLSGARWTSPPILCLDQNDVPLSESI
jgi:hypothetical protein